AFSFGPVTNSLKGEFTAGLFLEYLADQGSTIRVDFDEVSLSVIPKSASIRPAIPQAVSRAAATGLRCTI
ncbi:MAG TPA: hypothetical protein VM123_14305, partial [archaeon]|nr:hypothetical protein [archaeon]